MLIQSISQIAFLGCQCESDGANSCDPQTGRCECLPGVTGARCDRCLDRWIFLPDQGCQECDSCIHLLLDDLGIMDHNVSTIVGELEHVSVGVGAIRRLDQINGTVHQLRVSLNSLYWRFLFIWFISQRPIYTLVSSSSSCIVVVICVDRPPDHRIRHSNFIF